MKKYLSILLCAVMLLSLLAGCGGGNQTEPTEGKHTHTYATEWSYDETSHWYQATCGHDALKANFGDHLDENLDGICDVCSYVDASCQHTYSDVWSSDAESHWKAATCNHIGSIAEKGAHTDENNDGACDVCAYMGEHEHTFQDAWTFDGTQHWHEASCGHDVTSEKLNHEDTNNDGACDTCGWYDETHTHTFSEEWKSDVTYHWHAATCEHMGAVSEKDQHADTDEDGFCDTCAYLMCTHEDFDLDGECDTCGWSDPEHTHEFGEEIGSDVNGHWYVATCHPGAISPVEEHVDSNNDGVCDVCSFQICGHSFASVWSYDDTHHWHAILCTCAIDRKGYAQHVDADNDGGCDVCMFGLPVEAVFEVILKDEPHTIVEEKMITYSAVIINFPQPGKYVITPSDEYVQVWLTNDNSFHNTGSSLTVEVEEAGEMTLYFKYFDWDFYQGKEHNFTYSVVRMDDLVIETMQGKVELPANTLYTVKFIAHEVGTHKLITGVDGLVIGLTEDSMEFYKGHIELVVTEVGQEFTFYILYEDPTVHSFVFDWRLEEPFCLSVGEGNYAVDVGPTQVDYKIEFTAPTDGYFLLQVHNQWLTFAAMGEVYDEPVRLETMEVLTHYMTAGEVYTVWLQTVYNYPEATNVYDTLTITNVGEKFNYGVVYDKVVDSDLDLPNDKNTLTFTATESCHYRIYTTGCVWYDIIIDGNEEGAIRTYPSDEYYELYLEKGQTCKIVCEGTEMAHIRVIPVDYSIAGGIVNPGMEGSRYCFQAPTSSYYHIEVTGGELGIIAPNGSVTWISNAHEVNMSQGETYSFMLRGAGDVTVKISAVDYSLNLVEGDNRVTLVPNRYYSVITEADTDLDPNNQVALTWTGNIFVYVNGKEVAQGETITLWDADVTIVAKGSTDVEAVITVTIVYDSNTGVDGETEVSLVVNQMAILAANIDGKDTGAKATFTAEYGGTYTLYCSTGAGLIYVVNADGSRTQVIAGEATYSFSLEAGQTIEFFVTTNDGEAASVAITVQHG